jgi:hypothetical protein
MTQSTVTIGAGDHHVLALHGSLAASVEEFLGRG